MTEQKENLGEHKPVITPFEDRAEFERIMSSNNYTSQEPQGSTITAAQRDMWRQARSLFEQTNPPTDQRDYLEKGIPKPDDGPNAKQDQTESCLTCVKLKKTCHGTEVTGGKCRQCNGKSGDSTTTKSCQWLNPLRNIWNYDAAFADSNAKPNPQNSKAGRAARETRKEHFATAGTRRSPEDLTSLELWPAAFPLLKEAASEIDTESEPDDMARLEAVFNRLTARNFMLGGTAGYPERQPKITAQQVVLQTLLRMKRSGRGLTVDDVEGLATASSKDSNAR